MKPPNGGVRTPEERARVESAVGDFFHGFGLLAGLREATEATLFEGIPSFSSGGRRSFFATSEPHGIVDRLASVPRPYPVAVFPGADGELLGKWLALGYRRRYVEYLMGYSLEGFEASVPRLPFARATTADELERLSAAKASGRMYAAALLEDERVHTLFLHEGDTMLAGANLVVLGDRDGAFIEDVFTLESRRRERLGAELVRGLLGEAKRAGVSRCTLVSTPAAKVFWDEVGFELVSEFHGLQKL